jgi:hypothetical protein
MLKFLISLFIFTLHFSSLSGNESREELHVERFARSLMGVTSLKINDTPWKSFKNLKDTLIQAAIYSENAMIRAKAIHLADFFDIPVKQSKMNSTTEYKNTFELLKEVLEKNESFKIELILDETESKSLAIWAENKAQTILDYYKLDKETSTSSLFEAKDLIWIYILTRDFQSKEEVRSLFPSETDYNQLVLEELLSPTFHEVRGQSVIFKYTPFSDYRTNWDKYWNYCTLIEKIFYRKEAGLGFYGVIRYFEIALETNLSFFLTENKIPCPIFDTTLKITQAQKSNKELKEKIEQNRDLLEESFHKQTITKVIRGIFGPNTLSYKKIVNKLGELDKL